MIRRGSVSIIRVGLVLVLAVAVAVAANIILLGVATGPKDPVGRLSPRAGVVQLPAGSTAGVSTTPKPGTAGARADGEHAAEGPDD
jgi:hypothetical protein